MDKAFRMNEWARSTNIYEVNIRQYTPEGTFGAFARHLPRLKEMGVETLWFMPIYPIGKERRLGTVGSYYSIRDYRATNPEFGTLEDFRTLVRQAHQIGFKVVLDWVANHAAWDHVWTKEHPDFFVHNHDGGFQSPYDWHDVIQIDHANPEQQRAMLDCMRFWVEDFGIDGFRCDMAHLVPLDFWRNAREELDKIRPLFWLAETEEQHYFQVFDAIYAWEFLHKMEAYWRRETDLAGLYGVLEKYRHLTTDNKARAFFTSNHDENSHSGSEYERMGGAAVAFAVVCATWCGLPLVYSGQELPVRKRIRFFDKDPIEWTHDPALHEFYKRLLHLHHTNIAMRAGDPHTLPERMATSHDHTVLAYRRRQEDMSVLVLVNLSGEQHDVSINDESVSGRYAEIFSTEAVTVGAGSNFRLPAWGYQVLVSY